MDDLVRKAYSEKHCNKDGVQDLPVEFEKFRREMLSTCPSESRKELKASLKRFDRELYVTLCEGFPLDQQGRFIDGNAVWENLQYMRPDMCRSVAIRAFDKIRERNAAVGRVTRSAAKAPVATTSTKTIQAVTQATTMNNGTASKQRASAESIKVSTDTKQPEQAIATSIGTEGLQEKTPTVDDILAKKLKQLETTTKTDPSEQDDASRTAALREAPDFQQYGQLLVNRNQHVSLPTSQSSMERSIYQAPLLAANVIAAQYKDLVPQYGLLGSFEDEGEYVTNSQLFLNTNVPFSAFICGVQGSGKSHTVSCVLENAVIPSPNLGHLQSPASTLVFSYGEWSSRGTGFNISEATFLGAENPKYPGHCVRRVNVLVSPSNPAIKTLYQRLPNVRIIPFRLNAKTLDVGALYMLMAVDEKSTVPLYMARVEAILRDIACESKDGSLDYAQFKNKIAQEKFDPTQKNMLNMRLNLLESFLDMTGNGPEPDFQPGEITIIDLSDAFISPGTACVLFKLGLERFLQSPTPGKMVILDEAHKYMTNTPGSKVLTDYLTRVIRLQRHQGARVVISTQEPTVSTDLIALCSITVIHRFTSPAWYSALRKHINVADDDRVILQQIENLETGEALVYAPNAVLGKDDDGGLIKATGRLMRVNIRNRITLDGGASIMAV